MEPPGDAAFSRLARVSTVGQADEMNPGKFIDLAEKLAQDPSAGPEGFRSAISRAYYGAFLSTLSLVETVIGVQCKIGTLSEHQALQRLLMNCQVAEAAELGQMLSNLHEQRKGADYDMDDPEYEDAGAAQLGVARAEQIMNQLQRCTPMAVRQKIYAGMVQYRGRV
jgi:uncharacterized protein (UPF0332 family)